MNLFYFQIQRRVQRSATGPRLGQRAFRNIPVDTVIANLVIEDEEEDMFEVDVLEPGEE